jgi:hypothetical protein
VAVVEIQGVDGEENQSGEDETIRAGFFGHLRMLAEGEVDSRRFKVES